MSVPLFVAQEIGHTLLNEDMWMPTVTIDVSTSPAVADLARVHSVEGIGDVSTSVDKTRVYIPIGNVLMPCISVSADYEVVRRGLTGNWDCEQSALLLALLRCNRNRHLARTCTKSDELWGFEATYKSRCLCH